MTVADHRRINLKRIVDEKFGGNQSAFGTRVGRKPSVINGLVHGKRSFGEKIARSIERKLGKNYLGCLDLIPIGATEGVSETVVPYSVDTWPFDFEVERFMRLTIHQRGQIERLLLLMIRDFEDGGGVAAAGEKKAGPRR